MKTTRYQPVICKCGTTLDAASSVSDAEAVPEEGDVSLCLRCGQLFIFSGPNFREMSDEEFLDLTLEFKEQLNQLERRRKQAMAILDAQEKPNG